MVLRRVSCRVVLSLCILLSYVDGSNADTLLNHAENSISNQWTVTADATDSPANLPPSTHTVYISQSDIDVGPYLISQPGTYILSENLRFDGYLSTPQHTNAVPATSPNDYTAPTMPRYESGINVFADDVVIDLNGYIMEMTYPFYVQQRGFSILTLGDPASFNDSERSPTSSIVIQNGALGLTSHRAILGFNVQGLTVNNVEIANFDVVGLQCDGCSAVSVMATSIGPQNSNIPVLQRYLHSRSLLPFLRVFADSHGSQTVEFTDRDPVSVLDLIDRMVTQMNMVYDHVVHGVVFNDDDVEWQSAKRLYLNPSGVTDLGASYGITFNAAGDSVSGDITLDNVQITGLYANPQEKLKMTDSAGNDVHLLFGDTIDVEAVLDQMDDLSATRYVGDAYTDLMFAIDSLSDADPDTIPLSESMWLTKEWRDLVFNGNATGFSTSLYVAGAVDMALQPVEGAIGLRSRNVGALNVQQCSIHNVINYGFTGSSIPFNFGSATVGVYTGNPAKGVMMHSTNGTIDGLEIHDIESYFGAAHGVLILDESSIGTRNVRIRNVQAGSRMV